MTYPILLCGEWIKKPGERGNDVEFGRLNKLLAVGFLERQDLVQVLVQQASKFLYQRLHPQCNMIAQFKQDSFIYYTQK